MRAFWTLGVAAALLLAGGGAAPAAAKGQVTELVGYEVTCAVIAGEKEWVSGQTYHVRGEIDTTRVLAFAETEQGKPDPIFDLRFTGRNAIILNAEINTKTGAATVHGTTTLRIDRGDGAWETTFTGTFRDGVAAIRANGKGTGSLEGLTSRVVIQSLDPGAELPTYVTEACGVGVGYLGVNQITVQIFDRGRP